MRNSFFFSLLVLFLFLSCSRQPLSLIQKTDEKGMVFKEVNYKEIDSVLLTLRLYYPPSAEKDEPYPAIIFFFGGGWRGGAITQFTPQARHFARRGMVAVLADYRVESRHGTTPFDAVRDARSAIRFLRQHAAPLGIDPDRIAGSGGSAGGHLAAAAATIESEVEPGESRKISPRPNALVLFNPVIDNGPEGYGYERVGGEARFREISPLHNIRPGTPPTIIFLGTEDSLIPVKTAESYCQKMKLVGSRCELKLYEGRGHGFFNRNRSPEHYRQTLDAADRFLVSLGYLPVKSSSRQRDQ